ncbi:hypothetical protein Ddc_17629 [Ditylenchus destructor]|nr:hypothetical protein Ddc_17629 [Ditylenchus destructor]
MTSLLNEIFSNITNFLPNNDITDLMLLSRKFNVLVTPRLQKIDQKMGTMKQSILSFMPLPESDPADHKWISQLELKRFKPIGSNAKRRMMKVFQHPDDVLCCLQNAKMCMGTLDMIQKGMSLERFDDTTFIRILGTLVAMPKFRQEYNISYNFYARSNFKYYIHNLYYLNWGWKVKPDHGLGSFDDVIEIWSFYDKKQ